MKRTIWLRTAVAVACVWAVMLLGLYPASSFVQTRISKSSDAAAQVFSLQAAAQSLPTVSQETPADDGESSTMRPLRFGATVTTALPAAGSGVVYILNVTERGHIQYTLGYPSNGPFSDVGWKLTLYEEYDITGNSGGKAYRMLNILTSSVAADSVTSACIGVQVGTYRLVLEQNGAFSRNDVTVLAEFTAEIERELEPNDTPERYTELYVGHAMYGASSKYATSTDTDEDWYLFRMPYDGYAHYTFTHGAMNMTSVGWQVYLYDENLNQLSFNNAALSENSVTGEEVGLKKGIYFLCVRGRVHTPQDYRVRVDCTHADLYEQESNDILEAATPLTVGQGYSGMMNNRSQGIDYDYYRLTLSKAGALSLSFRHAASEDEKDGWNITLLNQSGDVIYNDVSNWNDSVVLSPEMGVSAGTYYVRIDSDNRYLNNTPYIIQANFTVDRFFEAEPNNEPAAATTMSLNKNMKGSLTQAGLVGDRDYFVFTLDEDAKLSLTFSHEARNLDRFGWGVTLTDADGDVITPFDKNGLPFTDSVGSVYNCLPVNWNQSEAVGYYTLRPGTYYVCAEPGDYFSSETYTLTVKG